MKKSKKNEPSNVPKEFMKLLKEIFPDSSKKENKNKPKK